MPSYPIFLERNDCRWPIDLAVKRHEMPAGSVVHTIRSTRNRQRRYQRDAGESATDRNAGKSKYRTSCEFSKGYLPELRYVSGKQIAQTTKSLISHEDAL